jgi:hypothetical protein
MKLITVYNPEYYTSKGVNIDNIKSLITEECPLYVVRHVDAINMSNGSNGQIKLQNIIGVVKKIRFEFDVFLIEVELVKNAEEKSYYDLLKTRKIFGIFPFFIGEVGNNYCLLKELKCFVFKIRSEK